MARNSATEYSFTCQGTTGMSPWLFWGVEQMKLPPGATTRRTSLTKVSTWSTGRCSISSMAVAPVTAPSASDKAKQSPTS